MTDVTRLRRPVMTAEDSRLAMIAYVSLCAGVLTVYVAVSLSEKRTSRKRYAAQEKRTQEMHSLSIEARKVELGYLRKKLEEV